MDKLDYELALANVILYGLGVKHTTHKKSTDPRLARTVDGGRAVTRPEVPATTGRERRKNNTGKAKHVTHVLPMHT